MVWLCVVPLFDRGSVCVSCVTFTRFDRRKKEGGWSSIHPPHRTDGEREQQQCQERTVMSKNRPCEACEHPFSSDVLFCPKCGKANLIGQIAGAYRLVKRLGAGGMGVVYLAEHTKLGTPFAVKVLHRDVVSNQQVAQRFLQEAKATSRLRHEHIIFLADYGEIPKVSPYIAMEFLEGSPLSDVLEKTPILPIERVFSILSQLCETMVYAHSQGIVHRDLKPDNLFLLKRQANQSDFLKVLDFGIAKILEHEDTAMTKTGALLGTPHYVSPEQVLGKDVDAATDVFATGVILFQMLTGRYPYDGNTLMEILSSRLLQAAPQLGEMHPIWKGSQAEALVADALQMQKAQRLPSMQVFFERLSAARQETLDREKAAKKSGQSLEVVLASHTAAKNVALATGEQKAKLPSGELSLEDTAFLQPAGRSSATVFPAESASKVRRFWWVGVLGIALLALAVALWQRDKAPPELPPTPLGKERGTTAKRAEPMPMARQEEPTKQTIASVDAGKKAEPSQTTPPPAPQLPETKRPLSTEDQMKQEILAKLQKVLGQEANTQKRKKPKRPKLREQTKKPRSRDASTQESAATPERRALALVGGLVGGMCEMFASAGETGRWAYFRVKPARVRIEIEGGGRLREKKSGRYCLYLPAGKKIQITISPEDDTLAKCVFEHSPTQRFPLLIRLKDADDARGPSDCYRSE